MRRLIAFKATAIVAGLLVLFVVLSLGAARQKSPTFDETLHLFAGFSYLKWGDFGINPEHPPLAKIVAALPLLALRLDLHGVERSERDRVQTDRGHAWELANRFLFVNNDAETIFFYAKAVMILLAVGLGIVVFLWARELFGLGAASAALLLYCFDPNILAHSSVVHTDVPFTFFFFAATYLYWRSLNELNWANLSATATCFALAAITKFSFVTILPIWLLLGLRRVFAPAPQRSQITEPMLVTGRQGKAILVIILLGSALLTSYLAIWLTYGLRFDTVSYPRSQLPSMAVVATKPWLQVILRLSNDYLFLPDSWIFGMADAFRSLERPAYLLGEIANEGFWLYFPIAFLVKTPLPTLILIIAGLVNLPFWKRRNGAPSFLLVPAGAFFAAAVWSHILPIYPFLFVWLGGIAADIWQGGRRSSRCALLFLAVWLIGSAIRVYPDYLAFFNEAVGGAKNGHKILVDSNLDWGQDLKGLKIWMKQNHVDKIQLAYFGTANPDYYGIHADYLPGTLFLPSAKKSYPSRATYIAISATYLMGYNLVNRDAYARFRSQTPVAVIGHSIWVYLLQP
jgi:hypothetical protein